MSKASPAKSSKKRPKVQAVVRAKTARRIQEVFPKDAATATQELQAHYSRDTETVIPVLFSKTEDRVVSETDNQVSAHPIIKRAPQSKIKIKVRPNTKKSTQYYAEKIPEITLKSKIKVSNDMSEVATKADSQKPKESASSVDQQQTVTRERIKPLDSTTSHDNVRESAGGRTKRVSFFLIVTYLLLLVIVPALFIVAGSFVETDSTQTLSGLFLYLDLLF